MLADEAGELARTRSGFLHWPLAFPEVFARERPGFRRRRRKPAVGGGTRRESSPSTRGTGRALRGLPRRSRGSARQLIDERPELARSARAERAERPRYRRLLRRAIRAPAPEIPISTSSSASGTAQLLRHRPAALGVVLPRSAFVARRGPAGFRDWLFEHAPPQRIDFLLNRGSWAFDMEPRYTVALLSLRLSRDAATTASKSPASRTPSRDSRRSRAAGLQLGARRSGAGSRCRCCRIRPTPTCSRSCGSAGHSPSVAGRWRCFPLRELHETDDKHLWQGAADRWPLWKGESFDQFEPHGAEARWCPPTEEALARATKPRPGGESLLAKETRRERDASAVVERTRRRRGSRSATSRTGPTPAPSIACLVPPEALPHEQGAVPGVSWRPTPLRAACLALHEQPPFDWQARRFVEINLNFFILEGLRLPALTTSRTAHCRAAARLRARTSGSPNSRRLPASRSGRSTATSATRCVPRSTRWSPTRGG